jgi:hypothetical protein
MWRPASLGSQHDDPVDIIGSKFHVSILIIEIFTTREQFH